MRLTAAEQRPRQTSSLKSSPKLRHDIETTNRDKIHRAEPWWPPILKLESNEMPCGPLDVLQYTLFWTTVLQCTLITIIIIIHGNGVYSRLPELFQSLCPRLSVVFFNLFVKSCNNAMVFSLWWLIRTLPAPAVWPIRSNRSILSMIDSCLSRIRARSACMFLPHFESQEV